MSTTSRSPARRRTTGRTRDAMLVIREERGDAATSSRRAHLLREMASAASDRLAGDGCCAGHDPRRAHRRGDRHPRPRSRPAAAPADDIAADYFRRRRYIGAKDRAQISGHVYARAAPPRRARLVDRARRRGRVAAGARAAGCSPTCCSLEGWRRRRRSPQLRRRPLPPGAAVAGRGNGWSKASPADACITRRCRAPSPTTCRTGSSRSSHACLRPAPRSARWRRSTRRRRSICASTC